MNVHVIADPAGRLVRALPALPGLRHDIAAAREHSIPGALAVAGISTVADTGYQGAGLVCAFRSGGGSAAGPAEPPSSSRLFRPSSSRADQIDSLKTIRTNLLPCGCVVRRARMLFARAGSVRTRREPVGGSSSASRTLCHSTWGRRQVSPEPEPRSWGRMLLFNS